MTTYRFRVKHDPDPRSLWRDVVVGADRTIDEFQTAINRSVGLDRGHLWFVGADEDYWRSDVKFQCPQEFEAPERTEVLGFDDESHNAGVTTIGEMVDRLDLEERDRICYLYDYGDEWRFYGILKEIDEEVSSDKQPEVRKKKGDPVEQYAPADHVGETLPSPLDSILPETTIPIADLRILEHRDDVDHVLVLLGVDTEEGPVSERFAIQFEDAGYLLEYFHPGWVVIERIDGVDMSEEELLGALASKAREWHADIADIAGAASGREFDDRTVDAMNEDLDAELERKGYGHL